VGGILLASFTVRSPRNYSNLSSTTAGFFSRSIVTVTHVSFLQYMIISSPLSSTLVSVFLMLLYTLILFFLPSGDKCAYARRGDRCSFSVDSRNLRSAVSRASITRRFSCGTDILLN
jgi:hypothetical protein